VISINSDPASIANETEPCRTPWKLQATLLTYGRGGNVSVVDLIALNVELTLQRVTPKTLIVPTLCGATARNFARFRLPVWIAAFTPVFTSSGEMTMTCYIYNGPGMRNE
jgi:pyruvate kinase